MKGHYLAFSLLTVVIIMGCTTIIMNMYEKVIINDHIRTVSSIISNSIETELNGSSQKDAQNFLIKLVAKNQNVGIENITLLTSESNERIISAIPSEGRPNGTFRVGEVQFENEQILHTSLIEFSLGLNYKDRTYDSTWILVEYKLNQIAAVNGYRALLMKVGFLITITVLVIASLLYSYVVFINSQALNNRQLRHKNHSLEKVNEELREKASQVEIMQTRNVGGKEEFSNYVAFVTHEINTPLNAIMAEIRGLDSKTINTDTIDRAHQHLSALMTDLSSINQMINGEFAINYARFDLTGLIQDAIKISRTSFLNNDKYKAVSKQTYFFSVLAPSLPRKVYSDKTRLLQILINLLNNAVKYSHSEVVAILVNYYSEKQIDALEISVVDYGIGVNAKDSKRLFDLFAQGTTGDVNYNSGFGMGLSISKSFVEAMGGSIALHNNNPNGVRVKLRVPVETHGDDGVTVPTSVDRTSGLLNIITGQSEISQKLSSIYKSTRIRDFVSIGDFKEQLRNTPKYSTVLLCADAVESIEAISEIASICNSYQLNLLTTFHSRTIEQNPNVRYINAYELDKGIPNFKKENYTPRKTILIIEDLPTMLKSYRQLCSNFDVDIRVVYDKQQALFAIRNEIFDLVLVDIGLQEDDKGYDVALSALNTINQQTPFVAFTGTSVMEVVDRYAYNNIAAVISKGGKLQAFEHIISDGLNEPDALFINKKRYTGNVSHTAEGLLAELRSAKSNDAIIHIVKTLTLEIDSMLLSDTYQQICRYSASPQDNFLVEHCVNTILEFLNAE